MPDSKAELKPCPLCSGENFDAFTELDPPENGIVRCRGCNLQMRSTALAEAIEKWNKPRRYETEMESAEAAYQRLCDSLESAGDATDPIILAAQKVADAWVHRNASGYVTNDMADSLDALTALLSAKEQS